MGQDCAPAFKVGNGAEQLIHQDSLGLVTFTFFFSLLTYSVSVEMRIFNRFLLSVTGCILCPLRYLLQSKHFTRNVLSFKDFSISLCPPAL